VPRFLRGNAQRLINPRKILIDDLKSSKKNFEKLVNDNPQMKRFILDIDELITSIEHLNLYDLQQLIKEEFDKQSNPKLENIKKRIDKFASNVIDYRDNAFLEAIKIKKYFSIEDIEIKDLKEKKEIYFVGENGDGKTILLQAILLALKREDSEELILRSKKIELDSVKLYDKDRISNNSNNKNIQNVFAYGINRNKTSSSKEQNDIYGYMGLFDTSDYRKTTLLRDPLTILKNDDVLIEQFIQQLNKKILIDDLKIENNGEIEVKEKGILVDFEKLSEGYKSTIIWLCDLVSRLIENKRVENIEDFKAIVLIDEIDLYLHPKWKYDFVYNLRKVFPNIQFIMITHSIVTILGASKDAVFYKVYKENGETKISQPMESIKNLMANTLTTSPLFDMDTARARNSDNRLETDEDFIYTKIHQIVSEQVKGKKAIIEDEIVELINKELDDYIKEQGL
jgi:predicted ATP-binding protein involved in virulence